MSSNGALSSSIILSEKEEYVPKSDMSRTSEASRDSGNDGIDDIRIYDSCGNDFTMAENRLQILSSISWDNCCPYVTRTRHSA